MQRIALFGSAIRDDFSDGSDIDVLLTFTPDAHHTLLTMTTLEDELQALFGPPVDVLDYDAVVESANYIRRKIIFEQAELIYTLTLSTR